MKVLITGGAGFIGAALTQHLVSHNHEVTVLDCLSPQIHGDNPLNSGLYKSIAGKANFIRGDVTHRADLERALPGHDVIVHFAAETGTGQSMYQIKKYVDTNIGGTAQILELLAGQSTRPFKMIVASSRSIYGEGKYYSDELSTFVYPTHRSGEDMDRGDFEVKYPGCTRPLKLVATDEESKIHPSSVYGITKQNQEQMVMTVCPTLGIAPVAFRYQNVYGPGQSLKNPYTGILSIFSGLIRNGKPINIFEDGKESRDFVFIDDVVEVTYLGIVNDNANGKVFNVGTGVTTDVLAVAKALVQSYGIDVPLNITGNYRLGDIRHNFADLGKVRSNLGFSPKVNFSEGIRRFCQWVTTQDLDTGNYDKSLKEMADKGLLKQ